MSADTTTRIKISKGQITIPESLREQYELHDGESILLIPVENGIMVKRRCDMKSLRGSIKEIDVEKASKYIRKLRSEWRIKGDL
ncbi:MAG: AbrB/MazE/SpoVT family DNA-binding domain-containing protein [Methanosarcinales archaeon]|nr:AbrB/MazE/SpoVT family DNA-binding domain-containing protein [Methanosarcinales archaeon]